MGKHKHKSKKSKHKDERKVRKRKDNSSSCESESSDEWVEKVIPPTSLHDIPSSSSKTENPIFTENNSNTTTKRDDWMNASSTFFTISNAERRIDRENKRQLEKEQQQYKPQECSRELNPYWKNGGTGLPTFKKPSEDLESEDQRTSRKSCTSNWKKDNSNRTKHSDKRETISEVEKQVEKVDESLSTTDLNAIAAKIVKAEILGNTKLVIELQEKLKSARKSQDTTKVQHTDVVLTQIDSKGSARPLKLQSEYGESSHYSKKKRRVETHQDGERVRYFPDDDKYSLKQMFEREKYNTVEDENREFIKMSSKIKKDDDMDDIFVDNIRQNESDDKIDSKNIQKAIGVHENMMHSLESCNRCIQSDAMSKHLMITMGDTSYLCLPSYEPLTDGHCLIVPIRHVSCATQLDENEWADIMDVRKSLVRMFSSKNEDVIFFETAKHFQKYPHMCLECVPVPKEHGDTAPIYFKKAIDESEIEWSNNKKLVSLKGKDIRRAVPKGLPYFSVSFGMEEGYAHVIEDQRLFPNNFAQEIIGGILDLHHSKWKRPKKQTFNDQSARVKQFSKEWQKFDCTLKE